MFAYYVIKFLPIICLTPTLLPLELTIITEETPIPNYAIIVYTPFHSSQMSLIVT